MNLYAIQALTEEGESAVRRRLFCRDDQRTGAPLWPEGGIPRVKLYSIEKRAWSGDRMGSLGVRVAPWPGGADHGVVDLSSEQPDHPGTCTRGDHSSAEPHRSLRVTRSSGGEYVRVRIVEADVRYVDHDKIPDPSRGLVCGGGAVELSGAKTTSREAVTAEVEKQQNVVAPALQAHLRARSRPNANGETGGEAVVARQFCVEPDATGLTSFPAEARGRW